MGDTIPMKTCTKCGIDKPATAEYFSRQSRKIDGLYPSCKECAAKAYQANRDNALAKQRRYYQENKELVRKQKALTYQRNKTKHGEYTRQYYRLHKEWFSEYSRQWNADNKDKRRTSVNLRYARKRNLPATFTAQEWITCLEYHNYCCAVCGCQLRDLMGFVEPHQDHWYPLSVEGCPGTVAENMICLCSNCNMEKSATMPDVWLKRKYGNRKAKEILQRIETYFQWVLSQTNQEDKSA